jgi:hypothetical protein
VGLITWEVLSQSRSAWRLRPGAVASGVAAGWGGVGALDRLAARRPGRVAGAWVGAAARLASRGVLGAARSRAAWASGRRVGHGSGRGAARPGRAARQGAWARDRMSRGGVLGVAASAWVGGSAGGGRPAAGADCWEGEGWEKLNLAL